MDLSGLEADFVSVAKEYSQRKGISYAAWREVGVEPRRAEEGGRQPLGALTPAAVSNERSNTAPSVDPSKGWLARSGCGIEPHDVAPRIAHAGDVVESAIRVVDVAEDDAVFALAARRASPSVQV